MITISVKHNIDDVVRNLNDQFRNQVPFATAKALTLTAKSVQAGMRTEMASVFDRPKPYTLGGTYITPATKANQVATVGIKDQASGGRAQAKYLASQISGGARRMAGYEVVLQKIGLLPSGWRAVPAAGAKLDRYGNMSQPQFTEIIVSLRTYILRFKGKGKRVTRNAGYFAALPGSRRTAHLTPGIYYRIERTGESAIIPVLIFVQSVQYAKRLDLLKIVDAEVSRTFDREFAAALAGAIRTAR